MDVLQPHLDAMTEESLGHIATVTEIDTVKARLKETWMAGDDDRFSRYREDGARIFYEQLDIPAGCALLDVACGSGQLALWAARDRVNVTGVDVTPNLVRRAQARAQAEGLKAHFMEGDAEDLLCEDGRFDVVTRLIGAMFAPRPEVVARELLRVCSPGGTIAMGNWTPAGLVGPPCAICPPPAAGPVQTVRPRAPGRPAGRREKAV